MYVVVGYMGDCILICRSSLHGVETKDQVIPSQEKPLSNVIRIYKLHGNTCKVPNVILYTLS